MTVEMEIVGREDSLPCHRSNILHTERVRDGLEVWYVETEGKQ